MTKRLITRVNDASDAVADAKAFIWAIFHAAQSNAVEDELSEGILACCNEVLQRLGRAGKILDEVADEERAREDGLASTTGPSLPEPSVLLQKIEDFARAHGIAAATVGRKAANDGKLVSRLRAGKRCWPETAAKVMAYIEAGQPHG